MVLKANSRLVRWTYIWRDSAPPSTTTLCRFFWRAFVFMPLAWLGIVSCCGILLTALGSVIWNDPFGFLWGLALVMTCAGFVSIALLVWFAGEKIIALTPQEIKESAFVQGVKTIHSKMCPIIYIL